MQDDEKEALTIGRGGLYSPLPIPAYKILVAARVELDQKKRAEMYAKCQSMLNQESGMVCFAVQDYLDGASKKLRGLTISGRYDLGDQRIAEKGWFA